MSGLIAILGAESTGKTTLARELAAALAQRTGQRAAWVPETLRQWCEERGRTPRVSEQAALMAEHHRRIKLACTQHEWVVADTTALMTAVYSDLLFGDTTLYESALAWQRQCRHSLLTACDVLWVADGIQRDGPHQRPRVDALVRAALARAEIAYSVIHGLGPQRLAQALSAVGCAAPSLQEQALPLAQALRTQSGLAALQPGFEPAVQPGPPHWVCACCSVPEFERALARPA